MKPPLLIFDSGLGGLTVARAIRAAMPKVDMLYIADHAGFPYGARSEADILQRVCNIVCDIPCSGIVIACNTASTIVLPELRKRLTVPIIGTVPAIKPACEQTKSGLVSVLATQGTVQRVYTQELIAQFGQGVRVTLVGSTHLAQLAEDYLHGLPVSDEAIRNELLPCFIEENGKRTDHIVLACTHYPLLIEQFKRLSPWQVNFIDPAPAIAARVKSLILDEGDGKFEGQSTDPSKSIKMIST